MLCRSLRVLQSGPSAAHRTAMSEFARRASLLKRRFRGRGQYEFARTEAQRFLDAEVPKTSVNTWMENSSNAIALSQVLRFFEVQPDATLSSLLLNTLVRTAEDGSGDPSSRLEAVLSLISMRPEENYERAFSTVEAVLKHSAAAGQSGASTSATELWGTLDLSAKVLQRCGKRVPTALNERLTNAVMAQLRVTDPKELPTLQNSLLRIYSWMVRAERVEARHLLFVLVTHTGDFVGYNYSTLMLSCWRHHQLHPLPVDLIQKLARTGLQYCTSANGRDAAAVVSTIARMLGTLEAGKNGVQLKDRSELQNRFNALLEDYRPRVLRFMDRGDKLYWNRSEDVTSVVFAYELGGHLRYRAVFEAYAVYVGHEVSHFEPTQLAMATGILRRAHLLTPQLASKLSERIEVVLGELKLAELSHICATFAALPQRPAWLPEAKVVALRLPTAEASGLTLLNLALAFPDDDHFVLRVPYDRLSGRQLVDILPLVLGSKQFEMPVVAALMTRLSDPAERVSPDDVRVLLSSNRPQLSTAVGSYLSRRFAEPEWDTDTLYYLPLVVPSGSFGTTARDPAKALAVAQAASISPEQFVSLVELLTAVFGDSDAGIVGFVRAGGQDLLTAEKVLGRTAVRYLAAVRSIPSLHPTEQWLSVFAEKLGLHLRSLKPEELESLLVSLHAVYGDVGRTPALQTVLSEVAESCYPRFTKADAQTARLTVLLVYLQRGMNFPLLTGETEMVQQVKAAAGALPADVRDAVVAMPLPAAPSAQGEVKRGRFILKQLVAPQKKDSNDDGDDVLPDSVDAAELDLTMGTDPFASPLATASAPPAAEATTPVVDSTLPPTQEHHQPLAAADTTPSAYPVQPTTSTTAGEEEVHAAGAAGQKERQTSYYTKFFNSSVGQLFMGKGIEEEDQHVPHAPPAAQQRPLRPRRTSLAPSAAAAPTPVPPPAPTPATAAAAAVPPSQAAEEDASRQVTPPQAQQQEAAPIPGGFFANWGAPPMFPGTQPTPSQQQQQQQQASPWEASAPATSPSPYGIPTSTQNTALFSSLFESNPGSHANSSAGAAQHPPTAFSSIFKESNTHGGNLQVPPGATDPTARPALIRGNRPLITRKGVITRGGVPLPSPPQQTVDPTAAEQTRQGLGRVLDAQIVVNAPAATATTTTTTQQPGGTGVVDFMQKAGLAKISGYNLDGADGSEDVAAPAAPAPATPTVATAGQQQPPLRRAVMTATPKERPLAWQEAARQVGQVSRYGKTKTRTRSQQSLSEWLNAPAKKLSDSVGAGAATAPPAESVEPEVGRGRGGRGRKGGNKAAADTTASASTSATTNTAAGGGNDGTGRGRGKHAHTAAAAATPAPKKGGKKAASATSAKRAAAKPKPKAKATAAAAAAAAAAASGKAKKAKPAPKAAKAAAKPKPKKTPAAAKKTTAGKKPTPKKGGKAKKK